MRNLPNIFLTCFFCVLFGLTLATKAQDLKESKEKEVKKTEITLNQDQETAIKNTFARVSNAKEKQKNAEVLASSIMQAANSEVEAASFQQKLVLLEIEKQLGIDLNGYVFNDKDGKIMLTPKPKEKAKKE